MSEATCATVRERIPDMVRDRLDPEGLAAARSHVATCAECRADLELVHALYVSRTSAPAGLAGRVVRAVRRDRSGIQRPWWGLSAAAVAALALGIGIASEPSITAVPELAPSFAAEAEEGDSELWLSEDGLLAGAPALDVLSDEALLELLEELAVASGGGAA